MVPRAVEQESEVARRRLSPLTPKRRFVRESRHALARRRDELDRIPGVEPAMHALGPIEPIELVGIESIGDSPDRGPDLREDVRDATVARTDRNVEAEPVAVEARGRRRERAHRAALEKDRWA